MHLIKGPHPGFYALVGAIYLFWGWQLCRLTLTMAAALVGGIVAAAAAEAWGCNGLLPALFGGALFALFAVCFQRLSVFILGGMCGAGVGVMLLPYCEGEAVFIFWTLFGFLLIGGLAVRFFKPMVVIGTSSVGAWSITHALALFLKRIPPNSSGLDMFVYPKSYMLLFLCLFGLGVISQCWIHAEVPGAPPAPPPDAQPDLREGGETPV